MEIGQVAGAPSTDLENYMFDLNGGLALRNALTPERCFAVVPQKARLALNR